MRNNFALNRSTSTQRGATLIVSLVILAVITVLGIASMRSSNLQLKMAASARDRAVAFQAAESALRQVERVIYKTPFEINDFLPTCTGDRCFTVNCTGGRCFTGDLEGAQTRSDCRLARPVDGNWVVEQSWQRRAYWEGTPPTVEVLASTELDEDDSLVPTDVPYMIEFLCFVPQFENSIDDENNRNGGVPLFRITVQATGTAKRSSVMLQSIVKAAK